MRDKTNTVIADRYELLEIAGRGGYGVVHRALDRQTGSTVAVKVLSAAAGDDPHVVERMVREQQALVALAGTGAVSAVDLCRSPSGSLCLVMEWLEGIDLERHLLDLEASRRKLSVARVISILAPVAQTLERAHEIGIVHRDVKPANIFLMAPPASGVRLLDFGLARMKSNAPLTALGTVMGSPSYIAPEAWRGNSKLVDHRADLYSLGVIVFRALAGVVPFATESLQEKLVLVTTAPRPSLHELRPDLPRGIDEWVQQALAIDPGYRFNTAKAMLNALICSLDETQGEVEESAPPSAVSHERGNALLGAWHAATALLRRIAGQPRTDPRSTELGRVEVVRVDQSQAQAPEHLEPVEPEVSAEEVLSWLRDAEGAPGVAEAPAPGAPDGGDREARGPRPGEQ